jgi:galactokinase
MMTVAEYFRAEPAVRACAPGRVNVLGEHTDYNEGFVLPIAIPLQTCVALDYSADSAFHVYSMTLDQQVRFSAREPAPAGFARYLEGCIRLLEERGVTVPPLQMYVSSEVPIGAGLSSSAALEVATLRALRALLRLPIDDIAIALIGQQAEIRYANVRCGVMDQMAASLATSESMLFLDTRTLEHRLLPLPADTELIVIDSGVTRTLASSKYNERRAECEEAARLLGVTALRDVTDLTTVDQLPSPYRERARHVVSENARVLSAIQGIDASHFGALMNASHASLRDDYHVSIHALDELSALLRQHPQVYGARLTGAGFGGAVIALGQHGQGQTIADEVLSRYHRAGRQGRVLLPQGHLKGNA